jgi:hypothetical protein
MEKIEKMIYYTFHALIKIDKFSEVKFLQKCSICKIASLAKKSKFGKKEVKKDKVVVSR